MLGGTVTCGLSLDNATEVPPDGAAPLRVTVQFAVPGPGNVPGVQFKPVTCNCGCTGETVRPVVTVLPFKVADSVALTVVAVELAVAVKTALDCPAVTVTLGGTVTVALLLVSETPVPPAGAVPLRVTVHVAVPGPVMVPGTQFTPVSCNCVEETVNPVVTVLPFNEAESVALTVVVVELAVAVKPPLD